jgi:SapC
LVKFVPLSRQRHGGMRWSRPKTYGFAAQEASVPVAGLELAAVATNMPMGFIKVKERLHLVALLSLEPRRNLFTHPDGRWIADSYIPAMFRSYPFRMLRHSDGDKVVLCVDEEAGLVTDGAGNEQFFDEAGQPTKAIGEIAKFLEALERSRREMQVGIEALAAAGVIVPWELKAFHESREFPIQGIHRIEEQLLHKLDDEAFLKLRRAGALPVAYAQLVSMLRLEFLSRLAQHHRTYAASAGKRVDLSNLLSDGNNDLLQF